MNKTALITGAGRGIGRALACGLAEDGFNLALLARTASELEETKSLIKNPKVKVLTFAADIAEEQALEQIVTSCAAELGAISLLINNAGVYHAGTFDLSHADYDQVMRVNMRGVFNCTKLIAPLMKERQSGYIINISSVCGVKGMAGVGAYCASKFALLGYNEALFRELIPHGVRVTAICPSWVATRMSEHGPMSDQEKIQPNDILSTVRYLQALSHAACVKEIVVECTSDLL